MELGFIIIHLFTILACAVQYLIGKKNECMNIHS